MRVNKYSNIFKVSFIFIYNCYIEILIIFKMIYSCHNSDFEKFSGNIIYFSNFLNL